MTESEMRKEFIYLRAAYPSSTMFQGDLAATGKVWTEHFADVQQPVFHAALQRYIQHGAFAPSIADIFAELRRDVEKQINTSAEWDELLDLCEKLNNKRCDFGYTWIPPGERLSQGAQAQEDAKRLYKNAPRYLKEFFGSYSAALQYAHEVSDLDSTGLSIRRRDYEQRRKESIADSTVKELEDSLLTDGLTKRVIGYTPQYMPIYEEDET